MGVVSHRAIVGGVAAVLVAWTFSPAAAAKRTAVTAAVGSGWSAPTAIIPDASAATIPHLVVNARGDAYVADSGPGAPLRGVAIAADGTAGRPELIAPAAENPHQVGLGISAVGTVTGAFTVGSDRRARVLVRQVLPVGPPRQISPAHAPASLVAFKEAPDGFAVALLCLGTQAHCTYALYARERAVSRFIQVAALPAGARLVGLAVAGDRALAAWVSDSRVSRVIRALAVRRDGRVSAVVTVAKRPHIAPLDQPEPALVPGGGALVAWSVPQPGGRAALSVAIRARAGLRFGSPHALTTGRGGDDTGEFRVITSGGAVLLCTAEARRGGRYRAVVRTWSPASGFSPARFASPGSTDAFSPFAGTGGGRTVAAWDGSGDTVEATTADDGSGFGRPVALSAPGVTVQSGSGPFLGVDARGAAVAVWIDYGGATGPTGQVELARLPPP